jgi:hypothetical protein
MGSVAAPAGSRSFAQICLVIRTRLAHTPRQIAAAGVGVLTEFNELRLAEPGTRTEMTSVFSS